MVKRASRKLPSKLPQVVLFVRWTVAARDACGGGEGGAIRAGGARGAG